MPAGSNSAFRRRWIAASAGGSGWNVERRSPPRNCVAWPPAASTRDRSLSSRLARTIPSAGRRSIRPASRRGRAGRWSVARRGATACRGPAEEVMRVLAQFRPQQRVFRHGRSAHLRVGGAHAGCGTGQADIQLSPAPRGGGDRERLPAPLVDAADRLRLVHLEQQRLLGHRPRQHLQRHLDDHSQRAKRTGERARRRHSRRRSSSRDRRTTGPGRGRRAAVRPARSRARRRPPPGADRRGRQRSRRPRWPRGRNAAARRGASGSSPASTCSSSASDVPPRTVTTSSVGS